MPRFKDVRCGLHTLSCSRSDCRLVPLLKTQMLSSQGVCFFCISFTIRIAFMSPAFLSRSRFRSCYLGRTKTRDVTCEAWNCSCPERNKAVCYPLTVEFSNIAWGLCFDARRSLPSSATLQHQRQRLPHTNTTTTLTSFLFLLMRFGLCLLKRRCKVNQSNGTR